MKRYFKSAGRMSRSAGLLGIITIGMMVSFSYGFKEKADDLWKQLGVSKLEGNKIIKESFLQGYLDNYRVRNTRNIATGNRKAIARDLLNYTKQFMNTQFKASYEREREAAKPQQPEIQPIRTWEQIQKDEIARLEKSIKETEANLKNLPEGSQRLFGPRLERDKQTLEECKQPGNRTITAIAEAEKNGQDWKLFAYKQNVKKWEDQYPGDFNLLIKKRLQKMLELTANVDFNAELKGLGKRKTFVQPEYEAKSREWKMAYRAGKDVTDLTRTFAQQWLNELK